MENNSDKEKPQTADSKYYDPNKPEEITKPQYNSTTRKRDSDHIPGIENLNQDKILQGEAEHKAGGAEKEGDDESLFGKNTKTDLGAGQRDKDEDEDEKIIRT